MRILDQTIAALRPFQIKGKGFVFDFVTPHGGTRTERVWGDYRMNLDLANAIHRQIFMGCFGRDMTVWARALLPRGGAFLDVGAHAGYFTLLASHRVGVDGRVFAVEPNPAAYSALQEHLVANAVTNVISEMIAFSEKNGTLRLYVPPIDENRDYNVTCMPRPGWTAVDVPSRQLDECLSVWNISRIDLMKMDVEGAEPRVLSSGRDHLKRGVVRHLIVEINGPRLTEGDSSPALLVEQLDELGFLPAKLSGPRAIPISADQWDLNPKHEYDRLFVHQSAL